MRQFLECLCSVHFISSFRVFEARLCSGQIERCETTSGLSRAWLGVDDAETRESVQLWKVVNTVLIRVSISYCYEGLLIQKWIPTDHIVEVSVDFRPSRAYLGHYLFSLTFKMFRNLMARDTVLRSLPVNWGFIFLELNHRNKCKENYLTMHAGMFSKRVHISNLKKWTKLMPIVPDAAKGRLNLPATPCVE